MYGLLLLLLLVVINKLVTNVLYPMAYKKTRYVNLHLLQWFSTIWVEIVESVQHNYAILYFMFLKF